MNDTKVLIGITGSISVLLLPNYLLEIYKHFPRLKIILTHTASQFIPKESLHILSEGIYTHEFPLSKENMNHIELARWADVFIIIPATADILARAAHGMADTLLAATILAYQKKVLFVPNMNRAMWQNKAVQRNVQLLIDDGHKIIQPIIKEAFEYASRQFEINPVLPSIESIMSILQLEIQEQQWQTISS
ncbi:MAG: flavoprotein [Chlamydiales bacterium]|nr:flavoprotein [Chlamydiales bacterium]